MQKIRHNTRSSERRREREHQEIQTHKQMSNAFHWLFKCVCVLKAWRAIYAAKYSTSYSRGENKFSYYFKMLVLILF